MNNIIISLFFSILVLVGNYQYAFSNVAEEYKFGDWKTQYLVNEERTLNGKTFFDSGIQFNTINHNKISFSYEFVGNTDILIKLTFPEIVKEPIDFPITSFCRIKVDNFPEESGKIKLVTHKSYNIVTFSGFNDRLIGQMLEGKSVEMNMVLPPTYSKVTEVFSLKGFKEAFIKAEELFKIHIMSNDSVLSPKNKTHWKNRPLQYNNSITGYEIYSKLKSGFSMVVKLSENKSYLRYNFSYDPSKKDDLEKLEPFRILATITIDKNPPMNIEGIIQYKSGSLDFVVQKGLDKYFINRLCKGKKLKITMTAPEKKSSSFMGQDIFSLEGFNEEFDKVNKLLHSIKNMS